MMDVLRAAGCVGEADAEDVARAILRREGLGTLRGTRVEFAFIRTGLRLRDLERRDPLPGVVELCVAPSLLSGIWRVLSSRDSGEFAGSDAK